MHYRFDGTFSNTKLEQEFLEQQWPSYSRRILILCLLTGLAYIGGGFGDYIYFGNAERSFKILLIARSLTFLSALITAAFSLNRNAFRLIQPVIFIYFIFIAATECIELAFKPGMGEQSIPFLLFTMITYFLFFNSRLLYLLAGEILGTIAYFTVLFHFTNTKPGIALPILLTFIFVIFVSIYFTRSIQRALRIEYYSKIELTRLSTIDELTGIYNRRHFTELSDKEIQRALRSSRPVSLLFLDVDHFKRINDTFGHDSGDNVLVLITETINSNIRGIDIPCRFGGEEFAILLPETDSSDALEIAERLRREIAQLKIETEKEPISLTISIGISQIDPPEDLSLKEMITRADTALYQAKESGRNCTRLWEKTSIL